MSQYSIEIEQDEQWRFVWEVKGLSSCYTQAKSISELMERIIEVAKWSIALQKWVLFDTKKLNLSLHLDYA
jgi:predicted RNase H-like HicB family nuclease